MICVEQWDVLEKKISFSALFNTELSMQYLLKALHVIIICVDIVVFRGIFFSESKKMFFFLSNQSCPDNCKHTENKPEIASN